MSYQGEQKSKARRFINYLEGHDSAVTSAIFFPIKSNYNNNDSSNNNIKNELKNNHYLITGSSLKKKKEIGNLEKEKNKNLTVGSFILWDIETCKNLVSWEGHSKSISCMACFSKNENDYLISGSKDGFIIIWQFNKGPPIFFKNLINFNAHNNHPITSIFLFKTNCLPPSPRAELKSKFSSKDRTTYFTTTSNTTEAYLWDVELSLNTGKGERLGDGYSITKTNVADNGTVINNSETILTRNRDIIVQKPPENFVYNSPSIKKICPVMEKIEEKIINHEDSNLKTIDNNEDESNIKKNEILSIKNEENNSEEESEQSEDDDYLYGYFNLFDENSEINTPIKPTNSIKTFEIQNNRTDNKSKVKISNVIVFTPLNAGDSFTDIDEPLILAKCSNRKIVIFEFNSGKPIENQYLNHNKDITAICIFSPSNGITSSPIIFSGCLDGLIHIWDLKESRKIKTLPIPLPAKKSSEHLKNNSKVIFEKGHSGAVNCIEAFDYSFDQNCPQIASCGADKKIIIWDVLSGHKIRTISGGHFGTLNFIHSHIDKATDKYFLISGSEDLRNNTILWDISADRTEQKSVTYNETVVAVKLFDPQDTRYRPFFIVGYGKGEILFLDAESLKQIHNLEAIDSYLTDFVDISVTKDENDKSGNLCIIIAAIYGNNRLLNDSPGGRYIAIRKILIPSSLATYETIRTIKEIKVKLEDPFSPPILCMKFLNIDSKLFLIVGCVSYKEISNKHEFKNGKAPIKFLNVNTILEYTDNDLLKISKSLNNYSIVVLPPKDTESLEKKETMKVHTKNIQCISTLSNPGKNKNETYVVTGSDDKTISLWEIDFRSSNDIKICKEITTKQIYKIEHDARVISLVIYEPTTLTNSGKPSVRYPLIISGTFDNQITLWEFNFTSKTFSKLQTLSKHSDVVVSMSLYTPSDLSPLLVTASYDKTLIVWELNIKNDVADIKFVRKLKGHSDQINSVAVYTPTNNSKIPAIIVSACNDQHLKGWKYSLDLVKSMPTRSEMKVFFDSDYSPNEKSYWHQMSSANEDYGLGLWIENAANLFFEALDSLRLDFFILFKDVLKNVIRYTNKIVENKFETLLKRSLIRDNFYITDIILDCWLENINKDINDPLTQRLYHASYLLEKSDLIRLSHLQPSLFIKFVSGIKLIKSDSLINYSTTKLNIKMSQSYFDYDSNNIIISSVNTTTKNMWGITSALKYYDTKKSMEKPVTSKFLPIQVAAGKEMVAAYINVCNNEQDVTIFDSDVGVTVIQYLWIKYAFLSHLIQTIVYLCFVAIFSISVYKFEMHSQKFEQEKRIVALVLNSVVIFMILLYSITKGWQIRNDIESFLSEKESDDKTKKTKKNWLSVIKRTFHHLYDIWNFNDLIIIGLIITASSLRLSNYIKRGNGFNIKAPSKMPTYRPSWYPSIDTTYPTSYPTVDISQTNAEDSTVRCLHAVASICVYFKILYYLRPFPMFGPLVSIIKRVARDILAFLLILFIMMCGFAQTYWILNEDSPESVFGTSIWKSYLYTFMFMLGQGVDPGAFYNAANYPLSILILAVFMIFMILLMLNLLIAIMNDSYQLMRKKGLAQWRLEQAGIILNDPFISKYLKKEEENSYLYVLAYTDITDLSFDNIAMNNNNNDQLISTKIFQTKSNVAEVKVEENE